MFKGVLLTCLVGGPQSGALANNSFLGRLLSLSQEGVHCVPGVSMLRWAERNSQEHYWQSFTLWESS